MKKLRSIVIGATGAAGQNIVEFLNNHPWFELSGLAASQRSHGKKYKEAIKGAVFFVKTPKDEILEKKVYNVETVNPKDYDLAFSALPSNIAKVQEAVFAEHIPVMSTASAYRYEDDMPLMIPEVNPDHIELIPLQQENRGWNGYIIPGPNCTTIGLALTLKPLHYHFNVQKVSMVSLQALSGAGEKGLREDSPYRLSAIKNVLPFIDGEEGKVAKETNKLLGTIVDGKVKDAELIVHSTCTRVFVESVHTEAVHLGTEKPHSLEEVKKIWTSFKTEAQEMALPSSPEQPIIVEEDDNRPQPILHRTYPPMVTVVGRVRENPLFDNGLSYMLTSDNLERGAGGGAVQTAEFLYKKGLL